MLELESDPRLPVHSLDGEVTVANIVASPKLVGLLTKFSFQTDGKHSLADRPTDQLQSPRPSPAGHLFVYISVDNHSHCLRRHLVPLAEWRPSGPSPTGSSLPAGQIDGP